MINAQLEIYASDTRLYAEGGPLDLLGMGVVGRLSEEVILEGILLGRTWG